MERLDPDVVPFVLEDAFHLRDPGLWNGEPVDNVDRPTLMSCALVNSHWRTYAQALLFRRVNANWRFFGVFLRYNVDARKLGLLHHVQTARVGHNALDGPSATIATLLERCPLLRDLTFDWSGAKLTSEAMMGRLRRIAEPRPLRILSLRILPGSPFDLEKPSPAKFYQFLVLFEALKSLWLAPGITGAVTSRCRELHFKSQLHDLRLEDDQVHHSSLRWLLQASHKSIHLVDFRFRLKMSEHAWMVGVLRPCCSSIRSLRFTTAFNQVSADIVQMCVGLEELMIDIGQNGRHLVLPVLGPSLRHLLIFIKNFVPRFPVPAAAQSLFSLVDAHTGKLQTLRLWGSWIRLLESHQDLIRALQNTCTAKKIELEFEECTTWADDVYRIARSPRHEGVAQYLA